MPTRAQRHVLRLICSMLAALFAALATAGGIPLGLVLLAVLIGYASVWALLALLRDFVWGERGEA